MWNTVLCLQVVVHVSKKKNLKNMKWIFYNSIFLQNIYFLFLFCVFVFIYFLSLCLFFGCFRVCLSCGRFCFVLDSLKWAMRWNKQINLFIRIFHIIHILCISSLFWGLKKFLCQKNIRLSLVFSGKLKSKFTSFISAHINAYSKSFKVIS